jgi:hypothetical protein
MSTTTTARLVRLDHSLARQMDDLALLMESPGYMGGDSHVITLARAVTVTVDDDGSDIVFAVGSTLARLNSDKSCILQSSTSGRVVVAWEDPALRGSYLPPGR